MWHELRDEPEDLKANPAASVPVGDAPPDQNLGGLPIRDSDHFALTNEAPTTAHPEPLAMEAHEPVPRAGSRDGRVRRQAKRRSTELKRGERWKRRLPEVCR